MNTDKEKQAFVVTSGEYSAYRIEAVFSTMEQAEEYIKPFKEANPKEPEAKIEVYDLDNPPAICAFTRIRMDKSGNSNIPVRDWLRPQVDVSYVKSGGFQYFYYEQLIHGTCLVWDVATSDIEKAIKVVNEKRLQILALNIWGDDEKVREMVY